MEKHFSKIANAVAHFAGKPATFLACALIIVAWAVSGPVFGFSDTWRLIINTRTTIITFLMVFLIQNTQNRDGVAIQAKLDEIIRAGHGRTRFVGIEHLTEREVEQYRTGAEKAADEARKAVAEAESAEEDAEAAEQDAQAVKAHFAKATGRRAGPSKRRPRRRGSTSKTS